ncbi:hypothetical protein [Wukongibacter baidiensis]
MLSPFKYKPCSIRCANIKISSSYREINNLRLRNKFKPIDLEILNILFEFKYLNKYNLNVYFGNNNRFANFTETSDLKSRLSFLWKEGIILRYYFIWDDKSDTRRSSNFYTLSQGGLSYLKKMNKLNVNVSEYLILESSELIFKKLAANQLVINYISKLSNLKDFKLNLPTYSKRHRVKFDLYSLITMNYNEKVVPLIIEPVRRIDSWDKNLTNRLILIKDFLINSTATTNNVHTVTPLIILVCEDDKHIIETFEKVIYRKELNFEVFYTTDVSQTNNDLSQSLYSFKKQSNREWCLFEHSTSMLK